MDRKGINFKKQIEVQAKKMRAFLVHLEFSSFDWIPAIRWAIYRTFAQPQLEYGSPIVYSASQTDKNLLSPFEEIQKEAMRWIFYSSSERNHMLMEGILGILPLIQRFSHLRCRFQFHLHKMVTNNPLRILIHNAQLADFLAQFRSDSLFSEFLKQPLEGDALDNYLLSKKRNQIGNMKQMLLQYILMASRTDRLLDKIFKAPSYLQVDFVLWRKGSLFINSKCICGES